MVSVGEKNCPKCGGKLKPYDHVRRIVRSKGRRTNWIQIRRLQCCQCGSVHREIPNDLFPFRQYEAEIIFGVIDGLITSDTLGYEDFPCEMTMIRWHAELTYSVMKEHYGGNLL